MCTYKTKLIVKISLLENFVNEIHVISFFLKKNNNNNNNNNISNICFVFYVKMLPTDLPPHKCSKQ